MTELVLIGLTLVSLGLTWLVKKPVKCEVVKPEVILGEAKEDVEEVQP